MAIQQHRRSQHRTLIVGGSPFVATGHADIIRVEHHAIIYLSRCWHKEILAMVGIEFLRFLIVAIIARTSGNITCCHLCRSVDARVGTIAVACVFSPSQQSYISQIGSLPNQVEVALGIIQVIQLPREMIGTGGSDDEPHHVVVEVIAKPIISSHHGSAIPCRSHMIAHIVVASFKHIQESAVACGFIAVENGFKCLCLSPTTIDEGAIATTLVLHILVKETV